MTEHEVVEHLVDAINDALLASADEFDCQPHHMVIAATAVAVKLAWASAADKADVRPALISMIEDFATQSEFGRMTEQ